MRIRLRDPWTTSSELTFTLQGSQKRRGKGAEQYKEIIAKNFPDQGKETDIQVQEAQRAANKMNPRGPHQDNII